MFEALERTGCDSPIRIDHVPRLALEPGSNDGDGLLGHVFATGYLRGLLESVSGKPSLNRWQPIPAERRSTGYPLCDA